VTLKLGVPDTLELELPDRLELELETDENVAAKPCDTAPVTLELTL